MQKVTISQAYDVLKKSCEAQFNNKGAKHGMMLHSSPGIGKSAIVRQIGKELDARVIDVRLSAMDASDVQGIPYVFQKTGEMLFSTPSWFPEDPNERVIIFFDEINNALQSVQHAAYRLILDREIHNGKKFHDNVVVIAAGNKKDDKTGAKAMLPALGNRFSVHMEIIPSKEDFIKYSLENNINHRIVGFLEWKPNLLHEMPTSGSVAFPSPRTWEMVSNHLEIFGDSPSSTNPNLNIVVSGCIGEKACNSFMSYLKYYAKVPNFDKIIKGEEEYTVPQDDLGLMFAITTTLVYHAADHINDNKACQNLIKIYDQLPDEHKVLFVKQTRTLLGADRGKLLTSPFKKLTEIKQYL